MDVQPGDRVLLLALPPAEELRGMAARQPDAIFVASVETVAVFDTRRLLRDSPNIMVTAAEEDGTLPWKEEFFSLVFAPGLSEPSPEVLRVLTRGGTAWVAGGPVTKR